MNRLFSVVRRAIWYPTLNECAQLSHFALGLAFVFGPVAVLHASPWWGIGFTALFSGVKEFVFDTFVEGDSPANNWQDFTFYQFGSLLAALLCLAGGRF